MKKGDCYSKWEHCVLKNSILYYACPKQSVLNIEKRAINYQKPRVIALSIRLATLCAIAQACNFL
jgi:hypothetical protein